MTASCSYCIIEVLECLEKCDSGEREQRLFDKLLLDCNEELRKLRTISCKCGFWLGPPENPEASWSCRPVGSHIWVDSEKDILGPQISPKLRAEDAQAHFQVGEATDLPRPRPYPRAGSCGSAASNATRGWVQRDHDFVSLRNQLADHHLWNMESMELLHVPRTTETTITLIILHSRWHSGYSR